jgi:serine/threonine protein kinase
VEEPQNIEFGKYRLIRRIAVGGMAQIWLAVQRGPHGFEKTAVLKVILPDLCSNHDFVQMFLDEARLAAGLDHSNVVRIYDFGEVNGQYYLAMEHLPGEDLASVVQTLKQSGQPMPLEQACDIIVGAATGLHFAHELVDPQGRPLNVVHRDVSPSNVIVTYHGTVKLVDFGIARAESNVTKTAAGTLKGKVAYLSPEQAAGEPLDRRSDVFALGIVLYELLTLHRVFKRESDLATLKAVVGAPIHPPSTLRAELPPELDAIVLKAMERDLSLRYQSAAEFADALSAFLVARGYVRSERALADYMAGLFEPARRQGKLRVAQAAPVSVDGSQHTPSQLKQLPHYLAPIRSNPTLPMIPRTDVAPPAPSFEVDLNPSIVAPTLARRLRSGRRLAAAVIGALTLGVAVAVALWVTRTPEVQPVAVPSNSEPPRPVVEPAGPPPDPSPVGPVVIDQKPAVDPVAADPKPVVVDPRPARPADPKPSAVVAKGTLTLDTTPWSEVFLKGKKLGDTPLVDYPLAPGVLTLTLVNEQLNVRKVIEVEIRAGQPTLKKLKL